MDVSGFGPGRKAPFRPSGEGALCLLGGAGLDVFLFREVQSRFALALFSRGPLHYGLYAAGCIPFFLVRIQGFGEIAAAVNVLAQTGEGRRAFADFAGEGEARLVLCGFPEPDILGRRRFVLRRDVLAELRQADAAQSQIFEDASACAEAAALIMARQGPGRMLGATVLYPDKPCD